MYAHYFGAKSGFKIRKNITSYEQLLKLLTITVDDQLKSKVNKAFKKQVCTMAKREGCLPSDFKIVLDKDKYPCLQYNFYTPENPSKTQESFDESFGFEMFFDLDYVNAIGQENRVAGITLYINSRNRPHYKPYPIDIPLQPGTQTSVIIDELKVFVHFSQYFCSQI